MDCANLLMNLVTRRAELLPQVVTAAKNIVRKYPELLLLEPLLTQFGAESVVEEEAKVSLVWMLGEYCDFIASGKDILRQFVQTIHTQEQPVQLAVLNAVVKVFLRNPEEMEGMLYEVVQPLAQHSEDPDVRDRALAYWRLLSSDLGLDKVKTMVLGQPAPVNVDRTFSDAMTMADLKKSINTAAVVFGKPYQSFLPPYGLADRELDVDEDDEEDEDGAGAGEGQTTPPMGPQPTAAAATGGTEAAAGPSGVVAPAAPPKPSRDFLDDLFGNASPPAGAGGAAPFVQPVGGPSASSPFAPPPLAPGAGPSAFSSSAMPSSAAGPYGVSGYAPTSPPYPSMGSGLGQQMAPPQGVFGAPQGVPPAPPTAAPNAAKAAPPPTSLDSLFS